MGDALSLVLRWVGPTREVVTVSLDLVVAHASQDLSLSAPSQVELPHLTMAAPTMAMAALTMAMLTMAALTRRSCPSMSSS